MIIPIVLDLLLWFGPRMSVAPLFEDAAKMYQSLGVTEGVTPEMGQTIQQMATGLREFGEASNLLGGLVSGTLMHVPSLYADSAPLRDASIIPLFSMSEAVVSWVVFSLLGILIGCFYLGLLARQMPIGAMARAATSSVVVSAFRHWLQMTAFVLLVLAALMLVCIPVSIVVAILLLISPGLGSAVAGATGILSMLFIMIFLYFVVPALIMDNLAVLGAIRRSIGLVRNNPWTTLGFLLLSMLIGLGFALLLARIAELGAPAAVIAIVVNAYIGTGLAMAWLVFYRTQVLRET
ncbi:MAG: hypothetical protein IPK16_07490 [Anaerolineales bacterium]|nr:hypothetical protein [Anaerolineales bacterium]